MKTVILSFDDSRKDFYTNVFPLLKKYQIKATLNVISDFVAHPEGYSFPSGDDKAMTVEQVKECNDSGLVEIACHGHTHLNTRQDVLDNIKAMMEWGVETEGIGFASSGSNITWENKNDEGVWDLVKKGTLSYVRSGIQIRREGLFYSAFSLLDRYLHSKKLYYYLNKRTLLPSDATPINIEDDARKEHTPFILSTTVHSHTSLQQIKYFIEKAGKDDAIILMFHSVLKREERGYGVDRFYYDNNAFETLLDYLKKNSEIRNYTTKEYIYNRNNN